MPDAAAKVNGHQLVVGLIRPWSTSPNDPILDRKGETVFGRYESDLTVGNNIGAM